MKNGIIMPIESETPQVRLRRLRKENKLTQIDLAKMMGRDDDRSVRNWEDEDQPTKPDTYNLEKLADIFHVSVDYLLCRTNDRNIGNREIAAATGLSETSIELLRHIKRMQNEPWEADDGDAIRFINLELEDAAMNGHRDTVFGEMLRYIVSSSTEAIQDTTTLYSDDSHVAIMLEGKVTYIPASGLYREYLMSTIRRHLDYLLEQQNRR